MLLITVTVVVTAVRNDFKKIKNTEAEGTKVKLSILVPWSGGF